MKLKRWLLISVMSVVSALSFTVAACGGGGDQSSSSSSSEQSGQEVTEGAETGVYYYDAGDEEYLITLNSGNRFTFLVMGENKSGEYSLSGNSLTLDFALDADGEITATLSDDVLTLTYENSQMRFLRKVSYTVSFDSGEGSAVSPVAVVNGQTIEKPADPTRDGYTFIGWYTDENFDTPFMFGSQIVSSDMTLYARWGEKVPGQAEFTVDFDLNYADAESLPSMQTVGGLLYEAPQPERDGYTFAGWWVSMYDDGEKLSYRYEESTVFSEDSTLYAVWTQTGSGLSAPLATVSGDTVSWTAVSGADTYDISVTGEDGTSLVSTSVGTLSVSVPFSTASAGDYTIEVRAVSGSNRSEATTLYYKNKALARVSSFEVVDPSVLVFEGVENAERYYITVDCGNDLHNHTLFDLGTSTSFNFAGCAMQEGGITFTVTAVASGYASSVSRTFVYNRMLSEVTGLHMDESTQLLVWDAVPGATNYIVSVLCSDASHVHEIVDNGSKTSYSLKECAAGEITVNVYPKTKGYNSPAASTFTFTKTQLATPRDLKIVDHTLTWTAVPGATGYEVRIGSNAFTASSNSFDMTSAIEWLEGSDYQLSIRATGSVSSLWSDPLDVRYYAMYASLSYSGGVVSWRPVVGSVSYQVRVNGGTPVTVTDGECSSEITLTQAGTNTISVRFYDGVSYSEWAEIEVYAHTIEFDTRAGSYVPAQYKAIGDKITLPEATKDGYNFVAWYMTPGGPAGNSAQYTDEVFAESGDIILYAYYTPVTYDVTYDYQGGAGSETAGSVVFGEHYTLAVPDTTPNNNLVFVGWYSEPEGRGTQFTDANGVSIAPWQLSRGTTAYAYWLAILDFFTEQDGTYSVTKGDGIGYVTEVTVPSQHNGIDVTIVDAYAFQSCRNLITVNIPETIQIIYTENSFSGCSSLRAVNIYDVEGYNGEVLYESDGGIVIWHNTVAEGSPTEIAFVPQGKTGAYRIPDGVTSVPQSAFYGSSLSSVTIPASVTSLGQTAFLGCHELTEVVFLTSEDEQPLTFGNRVFSNCTSLVEITLPARAHEFDLNIFSSCTALRNIYVDEENPNYSSVDGMLCNKLGTTILYCPKGRTGSYTIPVGITTIETGAFSSCTHLTEVIIPDYVTTIGNSAFSDCNHIVSVTFRGGRLTDLAIPQSAFSGCTRLQNVIFEDGSRVTSIGDSAFTGCSSLSAITIPASVATIGATAFRNCTALSNISFEEAEEGSAAEISIGNSAFSGCTSLTSITLPAHLTELNTGTFAGCTTLQNVYVDADNAAYTSVDGALYNKNITEILFYPQGASTDVSFPDTVTTIGANLFQNNTYIERVTIGKNVTSIGNYAFDGCINLKEVIFEEGGTEPITFGTYLFQNCNGLTEFTFPERATATGQNMFRFAMNLQRVTLSSKMTSIAASTFWYSLSLTTVSVAGQEAVEGTAILPAGVTEIASGSFAFTAISEVVLPAGVTSIGSNAFQYAYDLAEINLPDGLESIGNGAFQETALTSLEIPGTVTSLGNYVFQNCYSLTEVTFGEGSKIETIASQLFLNSGLESIELPETVTTISGSAFKNTQLTSIDIPAAVTSIASIGTTTSAFDSCASLTAINVAAENTTYSSLDGILYNKDQTILYLCPIANPGDENGSVTIPNTVATVTNRAFMQNAGLEEIVFAEGNTETELLIGTSAGTTSSQVFGQMTGVKRIVFPERLTELRNYTFYNSTGLEEVVLPTTLDTLGTNVFRGCTSLTTVDWEGCQITKTNTGLFQGATSLVNIVIPEGVTTIAGNAFNGCTALETVSIPASLTTITNTAFHDCTSLTEFIVAEGSLTYQAIDGSLYDAAGTSLVIGAKGTGESSTYRIPDGTTTLGQYTLRGREWVETLIIPGSVTNIGNYAFYGCTNLKEVIFEEGTADLIIGNSAFYGCTALTSIEIPARTASLGTSIFSNATSLSEITFAEGCKITQIPGTAFRGCTALTSIEIPASVTAIGSTAFRETSLTEVTFAEGCQLLSIGGSAFWGTSTLTSFTIPDTVNSIGNNAFQGTGITTITFPLGVTTIGTYMFQDCVNLESVTFLGNITSVGNYAFYNCSSLRSISLPAVTSIGGYAFYGCSSLSEIVLGDQLTSMVSNAYHSQLGNGGYAFYGCTSLTTIYLSAALSAIPTGTFYGCENLESVVIPDSVTSIGQYAFYGCAGLTEINIPSAVTTIGTGAFGACLGLETFNVYSGGYFVSDGVLYDIDMTELIKVPVSFEGEFTVPDTVTTIQAGAFAGSGVTKVTLPEDLKSIGTGLFDGCTELAEVVLPDTVTTIGDYAFRNTKISSINLPTGLTSIGESAFAGCTALESIFIPYSILTIGDYAFDGCTSLAEVNFEIGYKNYGNSTLLGAYAFRNCVALESITLPQYLRDDKGSDDSGISIFVAGIGEHCFEGCVNLKEVLFDDNTFRDLDLQYANVLSFGAYAFAGCTSLETVEVPAFVTWDADGGTNPMPLDGIEEYAFAGCTSLKNVIFEEGDLRQDLRIAAHAFEGCTALESLVLPAVTTQIADSAFAGCTGIASFVIPASVQTMGAGVFSGWTAEQSISVEGFAEAPEGWSEAWSEGCLASISWNA